MKKKVEDKLEIAIDTIQSIAKEQEEIKGAVGQIFKDLWQSEFMFSSDIIDKSLNNEDQIQQGIEIYEGQSIAIQGTLNRAKRQLNLCEPRQYLEQKSANFTLENWTILQFTLLKQLSEQMKQSYQDSNLKSIIIGTGILDKLAKISPLLSTQDRIISIRDFSNKSELSSNSIIKNVDRFGQFGDFLIFLIKCDQILIGIAKQSESAVRAYHEFLTTYIEDTNLAIQNIQVYTYVLEESKLEVPQLNFISSNIQNCVAQLDALLKSLQNTIKIPLSENRERNILVLKKAEQNKCEIEISLSKYAHNISERQSKLRTYQQSKFVPFILSTPFDSQVVHLTVMVEQAKKRLEGFGVMLTNIMNAEEAGRVSKTIKENMENWMQLSVNKKPSHAQLKAKIQDIQQQMITLINLRDSLGLQYIHQSAKNFVHPALQDEKERITAIINQLHELQGDISKQLRKEAIPQQSQLGNLNLQYSSIPIESQTSNLNLQQSAYKQIKTIESCIEMDPKGQEYLEEDFDFKINLTRELLKGNASRYSHF